MKTELDVDITIIFEFLSKFLSWYMYDYILF